MTLAFDPAALTLPAAHFIGGTFIDGPEEIAVTAPSSGQALRAIPCADAAMVDRAVETARAALASSGWGGLMPRDRLRAMHRWADRAGDRRTDPLLCRIRRQGGWRAGAHL